MRAAFILVVTGIGFVDREDGRVVPVERDGHIRALLTGRGRGMVGDARSLKQHVAHPCERPTILRIHVADMPVIVEQRLPTAFHRMLRPGLRIIRILVGQAKPIGDSAGRSLQTLQPLRPVGPTHLRNQCDAQAQAGHLALRLVGRVRSTRREVEHAPVIDAIVDHANVQTQLRTDRHILRRVRNDTVRRVVRHRPRLHGRMEPVPVGRSQHFDREGDAGRAGADGRTVRRGGEQTVCSEHLPVTLLRDLRRIAGRLVNPVHLVGRERDLVGRIRQFEPEADAGLTIVGHRIVRRKRVIVIVGHRIVGADDVVGFVLVVAAFVVFVERGGAGRPTGEFEFRHGGAVRVEHVVDGHVGRGLTHVCLRRRIVGLVVCIGSGLIVGAVVGGRFGHVAAHGCLRIGFGLELSGCVQGRIVRICGGRRQHASAEQCRGRQYERGDFS